jgi:hypothetical protein
MSELVYWVGRLFLFQLFYGGMIWFLIYICLSLATESKTEWLKNLWSWVDGKSGIWHLVIAYAIGWAYMIFYY